MRPNGLAVQLRDTAATEARCAAASAARSLPRPARHAVARQLQPLVGRQPSPCVICTDVHILVPVVAWDRQKAAANRAKHGVDFADAATVLTDDLALTRPDEGHDEDRSVTLGMDALGRVLVVVYSWQGDEIRLISARKATSSERRQYERHR
jgi:uncharacterized DUF497 family protein